MGQSGKPQSSVLLLKTSINRKNTFFFHNDEFEESWESFVTSVNQSLLILKNEVDNKGLKKEVFVNFITKNDYGLQALLTLVGFSKEMLLRLVTFVRVYDDSALNKLINQSSWPNEDFSNEWTLSKIDSLVKKNKNISLNTMHRKTQYPISVIIASSRPEALKVSNHLQLERLF